MPGNMRKVPCKMTAWSVWISLSQDKSIGCFQKNYIFTFKFLCAPNCWLIEIEKLEDSFHVSRRDLISDLPFRKCSIASVGIFKGNSHLLLVVFYSISLNRIRWDMLSWRLYFLPNMSKRMTLLNMNGCKFPSSGTKQIYESL